MLLDSVESLEALTHKVSTHKSGLLEAPESRATLDESDWNLSCEEDPRTDLHGHLAGLQVCGVQ